ncbi:ABC transporter permease [Clostridium aminobutyricum]|uniref:ABC transporter permease n=1 Tax=Clostridium aminobutyricum TaxID=33953 RepID=A0A939IGT7_CLOAM|nr:ABC transporter permease [Clostridium aminobutyricum]
MRVRSLAKRILMQLRNDKRTLALMLMAPLLILTLIYFVFEGMVTTVSIGVLNAPEKYVDNLYDQNTKPVRYLNEAEALGDLEKGELIAIVDMESGKITALVDGSNSTDASKALKAIEAAKIKNMVNRVDLNSDIRYIYGSEDLSQFDNFAAVLIGFLVFFLVFLISGISFIKERTTGTLEKMLSTPIKRWEIVTGYVLGFGLVNVLQSVIISVYVVYVLNVFMIGSIWLVLLITLLTAITALTLGMLMSTAANSEFQMIQFIPIIIVPQVFFAGLFQLSPSWEKIGHVMPLYYSADALKQVMLKGNGLIDILPDLAVLLFLSLLFMVVNTKLLKRYRSI